MKNEVGVSLLRYHVHTETVWSYQLRDPLTLFSRCCLGSNQPTLLAVVSTRHHNWHNMLIHAKEDEASCWDMWL